MLETTNISEILAQVADEVAYQEAPGGLPDGTDAEKYSRLAEGMGALTSIAALTGTLTWSQAAGLAFFQTQASDPSNVRFNLIKQLAVLVAWVNDIDNRNAS
jgi:hypothetical protein